MLFATLPQNIQIQIYNLTTDQEFQKRFGEDEKLDQLEDLKYDAFIEYCEGQLLLHNKLKFRIRQIQQVKKGFFNKLKKTLYNLLGKKDSPYIQFEAMTIGLWMYLYTIKSPIVTDEDNISRLDVDLFFYLLQTKDFSDSMQILVVKSLNYCQNVLHINLKTAAEILHKIIRINFRVLNMFPRIKAECRGSFNADWITSIATKVAQVSSYSTQEIYKDISFCEVYYLFAQYCRQQGSQSIYLRTEEEIQIEIDLRATELVVERLIEKGVIKDTERDYYIKQIHVINSMENN